MFGLVASSGLLNYTPIKAGMFGRIAYLKHRHGVTYRASVLIHIMIAGALFSALAICGAVTVWRGAFDLGWVAASAAGLVGCSLVGAAIVRHMLPKRHGVDAEQVRVHSFSWTAAHLALWILLAMGTIFMIAVRWWIVCNMMNRPITPERAAVMAVLHTFSNILPANGLGQREWLMGLLFGGEAPADLVAISLVDRAAEAAVLTVVGIITLAWLHRADPSALHSEEVESEFADE